MKNSEVLEPTPIYSVGGHYHVTVRRRWWSWGWRAVLCLVLCSCSSSRFSTVVDENDAGRFDTGKLEASSPDAGSDARPDARDAQAELIEDGAPLDAEPDSSSLDAADQDAACIPKSCAELTPGRISCGLTDDGCGSPIACGDCPVNYECSESLCESTCVNEGPLPCIANGGDLLRCYYGDQSAPPQSQCVAVLTGTDATGPYVAWCCS